MVLYFALIDMTIIPGYPQCVQLVCPAITCKDFMRFYEYAGWSESSLDLLVIFLGMLCTGSFTVVVHYALSAVGGTQVLPRVDNA